MTEKRNTESVARPEGCLVRIRGFLPNLRPSERKVAEFILMQPEEVTELAVTDLAEKSGVSDATIVKFCQRIGYSGYQQFKIRLASELATPYRANFGELDPADTISDIKSKVITRNVAALEQTIGTLTDEAVDAAVRALDRAKNIHVYGVGASGIVALDLEYKLARINRRCHSFTDGHAQVSMASLLTSDCAAIGFSHSGTTREVVHALEVAKAAGATTICVTNHFASPITHVSDIQLYTAAQEPALRSGATASRVAQLSVVDVLFIALAQRHFDTSLAYLQKTREAVQQTH